MNYEPPVPEDWGKSVIVSDGVPKHLAIAPALAWVAVIALAALVLIAR